MPQQGGQHLRARIDAQALPAKRRPAAAGQLLPGRQLAQQGLVDHDVQAGIAARHRMADPVALSRVEEQHLIGFGHGIVMAARMTDIDAAIGKHEMRPAGAFLGASVPALAAAHDVPDRRGLRIEQQVG